MDEGLPVPCSDPRLTAALQELRELITIGREEASRGELLDGEQVLNEMVQRHEERLRTEPHKPSG
jgi:hypothetical protein